MKYYARRRVNVLMLHGGCCERCGNNDMRVLQVDHLNGGGAQERKTKNTNQVATAAMRNPFAYQILCANCNWIKRFERDETARKYPRLAPLVE